MECHFDYLGNSDMHCHLSGEEGLLDVYVYYEEDAQWHPCFTEHFLTPQKARQLICRMSSIHENSVYAAFPAHPKVWEQDAKIIFSSSGAK